MATKQVSEIGEALRAAPSVLAKAAQELEAYPRRLQKLQHAVRAADAAIASAGAAVSNKAHLGAPADAEHAALDQAMVRRAATVEAIEDAAEDARAQLSKLAEGVNAALAISPAALAILECLNELPDGLRRRIRDGCPGIEW